MTALDRRRSLRPRKQPKQRRAKDTLDVLLRAAARVFARAGYAGATTNHIAQTAGVSIGSLYEYFPNKDALLVALVERHLDEGEAVLSGALSDVLAGRIVGLAAVVRHFVEAMVALHALDPKLHRVLFEESPRPPAVRRRMRAMEDRVVEGIALFLSSDPAVRVRDPARAARLVAQLVDALTHRWCLDDGEGDADAYIDELTSLVLGALGSSPRAAR